MKRKKIAKSSKRRLLIFGTLSIILIGYSFICLFSYLYKIKDLQNTNSSLNKKLHDLQTKEQNLKTEIQKLKDPDYLARFAREHYLYTKNGEYVIKIEPTGKSEDKVQIKEPNYTNIIITSITGIFVVILYISLKGKKKK